MPCSIDCKYSLKEKINIYLPIKEKYYINNYLIL